jgi:hypothetical protein
VAGIGAVFASLAVAFFVFFATPKEPLQAQSEPQSAHAMLARPSASNGPSAVAAHARRSAKEAARESAKESARESTRESARKSTKAGSPGATYPTASARNHERKPGASTAQARRLIQNDRRWAYQQDSTQDSRQDSTFKSRFLGYAD